MVDEQDAILARCIGRPLGTDWGEVNRGACDAMDYALNVLMGTPQRPIHGRRGIFPTLYTGYSFGGGQDVRISFRLSYSLFADCLIQAPMNFDMRSEKNANAARWLCNNEYIQRIAHFASGE